MSKSFDSSQTQPPPPLQASISEEQTENEDNSSLGYVTSANEVVASETIEKSSTNREVKRKYKRKWKRFSWSAKPTTSTPATTQVEEEGSSDKNEVETEQQDESSVSNEETIDEEENSLDESVNTVITVSYTHLTLPTILLV